MDEFNAKKSRAQKLRQDKHRDKPRKHADSNPRAGKDNSNKGTTQQRVSKPADISHKNPNEQTEETGPSDVEVQIPLFSKRKLTSNWDRYEESVDMSRFDDDVDVSGALFEELLSMPVSGGHLKLKHEHEWEKEKSELQTQWFQLDIQALENNLSTIPFTIRQNLSRNIFSEAQLQHMEARAKRNAASLSEIKENILKLQRLGLRTNVDNDSKSKEESGKMDSISDQKFNQKPATTDTKARDENQELDELLALQDSPPRTSSSNVSPSSAKNVMQDRIQVKPGDVQPDNLSPMSASISRPIASVTTPSTPPSSSSKEDNNPTVSLDDWLDSILDD